MIKKKVEIKKFEKKTSKNFDPKTKRPKKGNWKQRLIRKDSKKNIKKKKIRKTLQYILFLKKWKKEITFTKVKVLKAFLTKFCKIKARRKTRILLQDQKKIAKAIKKARIFRLLPFVTKIDLRTSVNKVRKFKKKKKFQKFPSFQKGSTGQKMKNTSKVKPRSNFISK